MGGHCEFLWDRRSGVVAKINACSGLVRLLGEGLDFCDATSELLFFCDNMPQGVVHPPLNPTPHLHVLRVMGPHTLKVIKHGGVPEGVS